ncbi:MAG: SCO family protein [Thiohalophilus sp.]|jgi:protein SCO1/2
MSEIRMRKCICYPIIALVALGGVGLGIWLSQHYLSGKSLPRELEATVLEQPRELNPFTLHDASNQPFNLDRLKGHWSFLFFGYTNCPDVCPTTLNVMQGVWQKLPTRPGDAQQPKMYFVSVDPDRDDLKTLKKYVNFFDPSFIGVTGNLDEIDNLTGQLGVLYGYDENKGGGANNYTVNHSAQILLIDPEARLRAVFSPPHDSTTIARNYLLITHYYGD